MQPQDPEPEVDLRCRCWLHVRVSPESSDRDLRGLVEGLTRGGSVFDSVVKEIFAPELKPSGFKKKRNVWTRQPVAGSRPTSTT